jgi:O-succinylbenzoic acid--CoA ligase
MFQLHLPQITLNANNISNNLQHQWGEHEAYIVQFCKAWMEGQELFVFQTSGSTGTPKDITITRAQMFAGANATIARMGFTAHDHFLLCLDPKTIAGSMMIVRALMVNAPLTYIKPSLNPLSGLDKQHPYTVASFVPAQLHDFEKYLPQFNRFHQVLVGGSAIPFSIENKLIQTTPCVYHTYGMTETVSHIALKKIGKDTSFNLLHGNDIKLDTRGCLCIKGAVTNNQWIITNDLVNIINSTQFEVLGRMDQVIITGGKKVVADIIEQAISEECASAFFITSLPHPQWGEEMVMIVESGTEINFEQLKLQLLKKLKPFEIPKRLLHTPTFFRTTLGKLDKLKIIKQLTD